MKTILKLLILLFPLLLIAAPDLTVSNLHLTSPDDGRSNPSFAWNTNVNADGYEISSDDGLNWIDVGNLTAYTFSGLTGGSYRVIVRAYVNSVPVPLFGGFGALLISLLFGFTGFRRLQRN